MQDQASEQFAFRAAAYVDQYSRRDISHSTAARFATIRYYHLMMEYRPRLKGKFSQAELDYMINKVAPTVNWNREDSFHLFWAHVDNYMRHNEIPEGVTDELVTKLRECDLIEIDALIDAMREYEKTGTLTI